MKLIIDAQLPPQLAVWIWEQFGVEAYSVKYLGLHDAEDGQIFAEARRMEGIVITKDEDCVRLFHQLGSPPKILWITCGNTSNQKMREILLRRLTFALEPLATADLVEISD